MSAEAVLQFWFGQEKKAWFEKNPAFDEEIRARFLTLYETGFAGSLEAWKDDARSCLARVILFDQFPRNMFRGSARAFAADPLALETARRMIEKGWDRAMTPDERQFVYLPFEHSESLADQERACELMKPLGKDLLEWAEKHRVIIRRFGRFPHRNAALGRESTPEEIEFLKTPGSGF